MQDAVVRQRRSSLLAKITACVFLTGIADLLFLLGIDHSKENRISLAKEMGCPAELMDDSAKMNTWLHRAVLVELAEHGGNIPEELLD